MLTKFLHNNTIYTKFIILFTLIKLWFFIILIIFLCDNIYLRDRSIKENIIIFLNNYVDILLKISLIYLLIVSISFYISNGSHIFTHSITWFILPNFIKNTFIHLIHPNKYQKITKVNIYEPANNLESELKITRKKISKSKNILSENNSKLVSSNKENIEPLISENNSTLGSSNKENIDPLISENNNKFRVTNNSNDILKDENINSLNLENNNMLRLNNNSNNLLNKNNKNILGLHNSNESLLNQDNNSNDLLNQYNNISSVHNSNESLLNQDNNSLWIPNNNSNESLFDPEKIMSWLSNATSTYQEEDNQSIKTSSSSISSFISSYYTSKKSNILDLYTNDQSRWFDSDESVLLFMLLNKNFIKRLFYLLPFFITFILPYFSLLAFTDLSNIYSYINPFNSDLLDNKDNIELKFKNYIKKLNQQLFI